jgi:hypothetical protein
MARRKRRSRKVQVEARFSNKAVKLLIKELRMEARNGLWLDDFDASQFRLTFQPPIGSSLTIHEWKL